MLSPDHQVAILGQVNLAFLDVMSGLYVFAVDVFGYPMMSLADGRTAIREYLCMTLSFDHDLVDGAPAARFVSRLRELIENGYGLGDIREGAGDDAERVTPSGQREHAAR